MVTASLAGLLARIDGIVGSVHAAWKADEIRTRSPRLRLTVDGVAVALAVLGAIATLVIMVLTAA